MKSIFAIILVVVMLISITSSAFGAVKDIAPPIVKTTNPLNNKTEIPVNQTFDITYNEEVTAGKAFARIQLTDPAGHYIKFTAKIVKNVLSIKPAAKLGNNLKYSLKIPTGAIADKSGNLTAKATSLAFTTQSIVNHIILRVVYVTKDWMPFSDITGWTQAAVIKESKVVKYYEAAIWDENQSVNLYEFPNDYNVFYGNGLSYEDSRKSIVDSKAMRTTNLYSCENFGKYKDEISAFMKSQDLDPAKPYQDIKTVMLEKGASEELIQHFDSIIIHTVNTKDFFKWPEEWNGMLWQTNN